MTNSRKRCLHCKKYKMATGMAKTPAGVFCDISHAIDYANAKQKAARLKSKNKPKKQKTTLDLNRETLGWQHKQTQREFNKMRVAEELGWFADAGIEPYCISCGGELGGDAWCCGHFKTVGARSDLRYDRKNTYLQHNRRCNMALSGDIGGTALTIGYKAGLIARFGEKEGLAIIDYCSTNTKKDKLTCADLELARKEFSAKYKEIKK